MMNPRRGRRRWTSEDAVQSRRPEPARGISLGAREVGGLCKNGHFLCIGDLKRLADDLAELLEREGGPGRRGTAGHGYKCDEKELY